MDGEILYIITATILFAICLVILTKSRYGTGFSKWFLAGYFGSSFLAASITYIVLSPHIAHVPHFFRTGIIPFFLVTPFSWLYFRNVLTGKGLVWSDLLHLAPLCIYLIDYAPFFVLSGSRKLEILQSLNTYGVKGGFAEGWFMPAGGHVAVRYFTMAVYWMAQWRLLRLYRASAIPQRQNWLNWLLFTELLIFLPSVVAIVMGRQDFYNVVSNFSGLLATLMQGCVLLLKPEILYGFPSEPYTPQPATADTLEELEAEAREHKPLEPEMVNVIRQGLLHLMDDQQRFRKADLKIFHLADEMGVPAYKLSAYFKEVEKQNFIEYINQRRIAYCISRIQSGEARTKTLEALSLESGFNTRSTFIRAFKKFTGKIPSAFMEEAV